MIPIHDEIEHKHAKLNEFDKLEWFDVCKIMRPDLTFEEYEPMWEEFQQRKSEDSLQLQ